MSFGCSIGDLVSVCTLAWSVYKSCKAAPQSFGHVASEVLSLHAVLKEADETVSAQSLSRERRDRLKVIGDGCHCVLKDLQTLVEKYQGLGTQSQRTWDRMRWGTEDIAELRARLTSNTGLLTAWISLSQVVVEKKLKEFLDEFRQGRRQGSVISHQTIESLSLDAKEVWRTIRKELEGIGITIAAFDANKDFIFAWFEEAVARGAFEEQPSDNASVVGASTDSPDKDTSRRKPLLDGRHDETAIPRLTTPANFSDSRSPPRATRKQSSTATPKPIAPRRSRIPRIADLIARIAGPQKSLITSMDNEDDLTVFEILSDEKKAKLIDVDSLSMAMRWAASRGYKKIVRLALGNGAHVNAYDKTRDSFIASHAVPAFPPLVSGTALQRASFGGHEKTVRLLLKKGAIVDAVSNVSNTPLQLTSQMGYERVARLLLEDGADPNYDSGRRATALQFASEAGHEPVVKLLLKTSAHIDASGGDGSALQLASEKGYGGIVQLLLEGGADFNADHTRGTALERASSEGHASIVLLLLDKGAVVNVDHGHGTALQVAAYKGHARVVELLLKFGAHLDHSPWLRHTPLHPTSAYASPLKGADYSFPVGYTTQLASVTGSYPTAASSVESLLLGYYPTAASSVENLLPGIWCGSSEPLDSEASALQLSSENGHQAVVQLLIEKGADINADSGKGGTPLQRASKNGHVRLVQFLLEKGADPNYASNLPVTALRLASDHGYKTIVHLLLEKGADVDAMVVRRFQAPSGVDGGLTDWGSGYARASRRSSTAPVLILDDQPLSSRSHRTRDRRYTSGHGTHTKPRRSYSYASYRDDSLALERY